LVHRQVHVLVATGAPSQLSKQALVPATISIVFAMGGDPVKLGVVVSLARSGGNITGGELLV
jgi:putative tryptophan/tyrosine transport system substrate-binding protein